MSGGVGFREGQIFFFQMLTKGKFLPVGRKEVRIEVLWGRFV